MLFANHRIVLPLYTKSLGEKEVPKKSGLNLWRAGGRRRRPGECYIAVPKAVRDSSPDFFPPKDVRFSLQLPGGLNSVAKVCQADSKALMSSPNHHLCGWLFALVDSSPEARWKRFIDSTPYSYADLLVLGFDSVVIEKSPEMFILKPGHVGAYEEWLGRKS